MELKVLKNTFKKKLINQTLKKGKKQIIEKTINKTIKQIQKTKKKNTNHILQLSITNATQMFKLINLTNKRRRKKTTKRIPLFLSNNKFRFFFGLKNLTNFSVELTKIQTLNKKFINKFLLTAQLESTPIEFKTNQQNEASKERKYFRHYRW